MKGFPNQVSDLRKIAAGVGCLDALLTEGEDAFGEELVRAGVAGTDRQSTPPEAYLRQQRALPLSKQSFRATARGLRKLYQLLGIIEGQGGVFALTPTGHQAAALAGEPLEGAVLDFWRRLVHDLSHYGDDATASHPYQVLLRLVARHPGIPCAKCALALEALDASPGELERIVALSHRDEAAILAAIGVKKPSWDNARKILPPLAEQLGDVLKEGKTYRLAEAPAAVPAAPAPAAPRPPRLLRAVTPDTIGAAGLAEREKELAELPVLDPAAAAESIRLRLARLRRHNRLLRALSARLAADHPATRLFEGRCDLLAVIGREEILCEVKTLDGTPDDERDRVREALAQLLYYETFDRAPAAAGTTLHKVACFEGPITGEHQGWLARHGIGSVWPAGDGRFAGSALAADTLGRYLEELA